MYLSTWFLAISTALQCVARFPHMRASLNAFYRRFSWATSLQFRQWSIARNLGCRYCSVPRYSGFILHSRSYECALLIPGGSANTLYTEELFLADDHFSDRSPRCSPRKSRRNAVSEQTAGSYSRNTLAPTCFTGIIGDHTAKASWMAQECEDRLSYSADKVWSLYLW